MAGSGQAVVFIHAGVVNLGMWDEQMDDFAKNNRVIRYDIRGWGETANPPQTYSDQKTCTDCSTILASPRRRWLAAPPAAKSPWTLP